MPRPVFPLEGIVRDYAWGSTTAIQELLGRPVDGRPAAELWFGAHPDDPAFAPDEGATLDRLIAADPIGLLGPEVVDAFGPRLPFLLKVLAADKALSLQVHPDLAQARAGFARENEAGVALDAPNRNYHDPNHKPELICALTDFDALCGFRPVADTLRLLDDWAVPELKGLRDLLARDGLRAAFTAVLTLDDPEAAVAATVARAAGEPSDSPWAGTAHAVGLIDHDFPGDVGAVLALLLNHVRLAPGEALFLAAGNVHAYLRGTGVEIMANSDNVLRCALTPKHVDIEELLAITDFRELPDPRWPAKRDQAGTEFAVPVPDFALRQLAMDSAFEHRGPTIALALDAPVTLTGPDGDLTLSPGHGAYVLPGTTIRGSGPGTLMLATVGG